MVYFGLMVKMNLEKTIGQLTLNGLWRFFARRGPFFVEGS